MFDDGESRIFKKTWKQFKDDEYIKILKHWSQMNGCIFKPVSVLIENRQQKTV